MNPEEASSFLGITYHSLYLAKKYQPFLYRFGKRHTIFDIDKYRKFESLQSDIKEETVLLLEYLRNIDKFSYEDMSKVCKFNSVSLYQGKFSPGSAVNIALRLYVAYPTSCYLFERYYDGSIKPMNTIKKLNKLMGTR